ncbi:acyl-CoA dehydrogenase C-terminal domain-containing protein [Pseudomonas sp. W2-17]
MSRLFRVVERGKNDQPAPARHFPVAPHNPDNEADTDFYKGRLQAARYFLTWEVPGCHHELAILERRDDACLAMQDAWF